MKISILSTFVILAGLLIASCNNDTDKLSPRDKLAGSWVIDSAMIEETIDNKFDFSATRKFDSVRIDFSKDHVYNLKDSENGIWFFAVEGHEKATAKVEGGVWQDQDDFTSLRFDRNVPEFRGGLPVKFSILKLTENELILERLVDPWELRDSTRIDLTASQFIIPKAIKDAANIYQNTPVPDYNAGFAWGIEAGYHYGFFAYEPVQVPTAKRWYNRVKRLEFVQKKYTKDPLYINFDTGYHEGEKEGYAKGMEDGKLSKIASLKRISKFVYYAHKKSSL